MTDKQKEVAAQLAMLASAFNREMPPAALQGYWTAVRDLDVNQIKVGVGIALREWRGKFMPTAPELRDLCLGNGSPDQRALNAANAWAVVRAAMSKYDYTRSVDFGPMTNAIVRNMGGWLWLCARSERDLIFDRKKFEELHQQLAGKPIGAEHAAFLPGQFGGKPVLFLIPGEPPRQLAIPDVETPFVGVLRALAEKKAAG